MKTVLKFLTFGMMLMAFAVAPAFAQEDECGTIYTQFTNNYRSTDLAQVKTAIEVGEQFVAKCSSNSSYNQAAEGAKKSPIDFVKDQIPKLKSKVGFASAATAFNSSITDPKNVNADVAFSKGKELIAASPNLSLDVSLALASVGFDKATAATPVDTYNAEAINYAKQAIQMMESGTTSKDYGVLKFAYKDNNYPDTKSNALGWMNYTIGYIMHSRQNQKKEAIPYLYKALQYNSGVKKIALPYQAIGDSYQAEYNRIDDQRTEVIKQFEQAKKDNKTPEEIKAIVDKSNELLLLQKGYAERMIDAYGRARALAANDKPYQEGLYNSIKVLYKLRFDNTNPAGLDSYLSGLASRPMPDPTTPVTPVVEATTTTTATTTSSTGNTSITTTPTTTTTNARPTTDAKTTTNTTTKAATTTTGKTTKTPAKTTPKKKGTR